MHAQILVLKKSRTPFFSDRKTSREHFVLSFTQTYVLSLLLIGCLGIYYVWALNANATKGYAVRNLELERSSLRHEENLLAIKIAEIESLESVASNPAVEKMVASDAPQFLVLGDAPYAYEQKK